VREKSTFALMVAVALIIIAVSLRVLPHPDNFAPITAIAIFGGAVLAFRYAIWVPLLAMIVSDAIIGFHSLVLVTWGCYLLVALAAHRGLAKLSMLKVTTITISASLFFFLVTNLAVWAEGRLYARTWSGLVECYTLALPFFRNTLLGDVFYTAAIFSAYLAALYMGTRLARGRRTPKATSV